MQLRLRAPAEAHRKTASFLSNGQFEVWVPSIGATVVFALPLPSSP